MIIYKPIPGYEGYYNVSDSGDVVALDRYVKQLNHGIVKSFRYKGGMLKRDYKNDGSGYRSYRLSKLGKTRKFQAHRLVAAAFLGLDLNDPNSVVCHLDDNPSNNSVSNLLVADQLTNEKLAISHGRHTSNTHRNYEQLRVMSERNRVINKEDYGKIINLRREGKSWKDISIVFGTHLDTAKKIFYSYIRGNESNYIKVN